MNRRAQSLAWRTCAGFEASTGYALEKRCFPYFTDGENPGAHQVLIRLAGKVGLYAEIARHILSTDAYAAEVREREGFYQSQGIHSVPSIIINDRHLIQGGQPPEVFVQALSRIAAPG